MRSNLAVMEAKIEPLEEHQKQLQQLGLEREQVEHSIKEISPKLEQVRGRVLQQQRRVGTTRTETKIIFREANNNCERKDNVE